MKNDNKVILYIGDFQFPDNGAAAKRVLNIGKSLREFGCIVVFAGNNATCRNEDMNSQKEFYFQGFQYIGKGLYNKLRVKLDNYYSYPRIKKNIYNLKNSGKQVDIIIGYHMDFLGMIFCLRYCKRNKIKFISDCTEWYDPIQTVHGKLGLSYYNSQLRLLYANKKTDGIIAISSFLENYYKKYVSVIRIPALDNVSNEYKLKNINFKTRKFIYFGNPGKKDNIDIILESFQELNTENNWELNIVGANKSDFIHNGSKYCEETLSKFKFHGKLTTNQTKELIEKSDFSIFVRPKDKRYSKAGFPTKYSESLSLGTPVITNLTSDISETLIDNYNGMIINDVSIESIKFTLLNAVSLDKENILRMSINAYKTAREKFHYEIYSEKLKCFLENEVK